MTSQERAHNTWNTIESNLRDRRGIGNEFEAVDNETMNELRLSQVSTIFAALDEAQAEGRRMGLEEAAKCVWKLPAEFMNAAEMAEVLIRALKDAK